MGFFFLFPVSIPAQAGIQEGEVTKLTIPQVRD